jgi:acetolactate synthase small subunit
MALAERDKRALKGLGGVLVLVAIYLAVQYWPAGSTASAGEVTADSIGMAEHRLQAMRNRAASLPAKQDVLKKVETELATREVGLIRAESPQQAQAQTLTILRELLEAESIGIAGTEIGPVQPLSSDYGLATVSVLFECRVEQLLNAMAGVSEREELLVIRDFQINLADARRKTIRVRLTAAGVVPKSLLPAKDKKGGASL